MHMTRSEGRLLQLVKQGDCMLGACLTVFINTDESTEKRREPLDPNLQLTKRREEALFPWELRI